MTYAPDVPAPGLNDRFAADEIILYGVNLNAEGNRVHLDLTQPAGFRPPDETMVLQLQLLAGEEGGELEVVQAEEVVIAAIYGFAYEGQCVRLEKPRIYAFYRGEEEAPALGCGFDRVNDAAANPYRMWRVKAKAQMMELSIRLDEASALLFEQNVPGRRAPNTYDSRLQLSHRGGRLTTT